jgi:serine/threonine protein kinase
LFPPASGELRYDPAVGRCEHCGKDHGEATRFCPDTGQAILSAVYPPGTLLEGKYEIVRVIGAGGMGAVFEGRHTLLGKRVAIKVLLPGSSDPDGQMTARLVREARAASATGHRNIATVSDMGWASEGSLFVVMEFLDGKTVGEQIEAEGRFSFERSIEIARQVLAGLEAVHRKGIVHRDLKPENLMVVEDEEGRLLVKILDFGISKVLGGEARMDLTTPGLLMGTPQFMSPEQAQGAPDIDHRTDLYSMGAILYLLLTGRPPIVAETLSEQIVATIAGKIEPPSRLEPWLPAAVDAVLGRALALDPDDRYPDARSFSEALARLTEAGGGRAVAESSATAPTAPGLPSVRMAARREAAHFEAAELVALDELAPPPPQAARAPAPTQAEESPVASPAAALPPVADDPRFAPRPEESEGLDLVPVLPVAPVAPPRPRSVTDPGRALAAVPDEPPAARPSRSGQARLSTGPSRGVVLAVALLLGAGGLAGAWLLFAAPRTVRLHVVVNPIWAEVTLDDQRVSGTLVTVERSKQPRTLSASALGYAAKSITVVPLEDQDAKLDLVPVEKEPAREVAPPRPEPETARPAPRCPKGKRCPRKKK